MTIAIDKPSKQLQLVSGITSSSPINVVGRRQLGVVDVLEDAGLAVATAAAAAATVVVPELAAGPDEALAAADLAALGLTGAEVDIAATVAGDSAAEAANLATATAAQEAAGAGMTAGSSAVADAIIGDGSELTSSIDQAVNAANDSAAAADSVTQTPAEEATAQIEAKTAGLSGQQQESLDAWASKADGKAVPVNDYGVLPHLDSPSIAESLQDNFVDVFGDLKTQKLGSRMDGLGVDLVGDSGSFDTTQLTELASNIKENLSQFKAVPSRAGDDGLPRFTVDMMVRGVGRASNTFKPVRTVWKETADGPKLVTFMQKGINAMLKNGSGPITP